MNCVSSYIKERLLEVACKGYFQNIEKEIPIIKRHDIYKYNDKVVINFWYYLDNELTQDKLELDLKKEIRDYKLNILLN